MSLAVAESARQPCGRAGVSCTKRVIASLALASLLASGAPGVELHDSGWAVSPTPDAPSVLGPSRIRVDRLLNQRTLKRLELSAQAPETPQWRRPRVAQKPDRDAPSSPEPDAAKPSAAAPPIADAFRIPNIPGQAAAPEARSLPSREERRKDRREDREAPSQAPTQAKPRQDPEHEPAPFAADQPQPIDGAEEAESAGEPEPPQLEPQPDPVDPPAADETTEDAPTGDDAPGDESANDDAAPVDAPGDSDESETETDQSASPSKSAAPETEAEPAPESGDEATLPQDERAEAAPEQTRRRWVETYERSEKSAKDERPSQPLPRNLQYLRRRLRSVLSYYYRRPLNSVSHDPWEAMHGMLAYGLYSRIQDGGPRGKPLTAVGYLCFNKPCKRRQMLYVTPEGALDVRVGVGLQGHKGQLLAMLAQCGVSPDYPVRVDDHKFTVRDLIYAEQLTCYARTELTFKLIALAHYLPTDATWVNDQGETWSIPKLIEDERTQPIRGAACGGTHRLSGLALAAKERTARGEPLDGEWLEAAKFVERYQNYAFQLQNRDGSLSTEWFRGRGAEDDIDRRVQTTGHILEWLIYSLPEERLTDNRTVRAVNYLTSLLASNTNNGWEVGPLSHALHALLLYDEKVFRPHDQPTQVAGGGTRPVYLSYRDMESPVRESYSYVEARHAKREESSGLGGLFGFGGRRTR